MIVKSESTPTFISQLTDWELISAYSFCNKLLNPRTFLEREEFEDICFFFFESDFMEAQNTLYDIREMYIKEFNKRHLN